MPIKQFKQHKSAGNEQMHQVGIVVSDIADLPDAGTVAQGVAALVWTSSTTYTVYASNGVDTWVELLASGTVSWANVTDKAHAADHAPAGSDPLTGYALDGHDHDADYIPIVEPHYIGSMVYYDGFAWAALSGSSAVARKFLMSSGNGAGVSSAPSWVSLVAGDIPAHATSHSTGQADAIDPANIGAIPASLFSGASMRGGLLAGGPAGSISTIIGNAVARRRFLKGEAGAVGDPGDAGWGDILAEELPDHASLHATGGGDAIAPADIGAATATHNHDGTYATAGHNHTGVYDPAGTAAGLAARTKFILLTAAGGTPTTTAGCGGPTLVESSTNKVNYFALEFDTTTEENAGWVIVMPDDYPANGTLTAQFIWTNAGGSSTQTVVFGIKARGYADSDAIDQAWGAEVTVSDTWLAQGDIHISAVSGAITIGGSPDARRPVAINVARKVGSDNMAGDARLLAVRLFYTADQWGE